MRSEPTACRCGATATSTPNTDAGAGWDSVTLGLGFTRGTATSEVYLDDVAIALYSDTSPTIHLGCE